LDVGVGTGHYLSAYSPQVQVTGIDLSQPMLNLAAREIEKRGWTHVELRQMDALDLQFASDSFDYVMGFHIVSTVDDPPRMLSEMLRVCKPGGRIVIINHFQSERRSLAFIIKVASKVTQWLGWRADIRCDELFNGASMEMEERFKTSPLSLFTVVVGQKPVRSRKTGRPPARLDRLAAELNC
jgi:phosphatidylethanolamine/phosphatidyl-N-methylethanolamine N-methyltransferase